MSGLGDFGGRSFSHSGAPMGPRPWNWRVASKMPLTSSDPSVLAHSGEQTAQNRGDAGPAKNRPHRVGHSGTCESTDCHYCCKRFDVFKERIVPSVARCRSRSDPKGAADEVCLTSSGGGVVDASFSTLEQPFRLLSHVGLDPDAQDIATYEAKKALKHPIVSLAGLELCRDRCHDAAGSCS